MIRRQFAAALLLFVLVAPYAAFGQQPQPNPTDPIERIKDEGMNRSQVMQTLSYLSEVIGPRLTASPAAKRANEWTRDTLAKWGLQNAHLEAWGPFGRGWTLKRFSAQVTDPQDFPLIAYPKAWSPGTNGPLSAEVVYFDAKDEADMARFKGQLKGKIVLTAPMREVAARFEPLGRRRDEKNLLALADAPLPSPQGRGGFGGGNNNIRAQQQFNAAKNMFFQSEGAALLVDSSRAGDGGTIFVQQATVPQPFVAPTPGQAGPRAMQAYDKNAPAIPPQMVIAVEHYNR